MSPDEQTADTIPPGMLVGVDLDSALYAQARAAYVAHAEQLGELPQWETLPMRTILAWAAAALAATSQPGAKT